MIKVISFDSELIKHVQEYADKYLNGNFSMAVRYFCAVGIDSEDKK